MVNHAIRWLFGIGVTASLAFCGCGGGGDDEDTPAAPVSTNGANSVSATNNAAKTLTGNWAGTSGSAPFSMVLVQDGDALTGSITLDSGTHGLSGGVEGQAVELTYSYTSPSAVDIAHQVQPAKFVPIESFSHIIHITATANSEADGLHGKSKGSSAEENWNAVKQ